VPLLAAAGDKEPFRGFLLGCIAGAVFHVGLIYWITVSMTLYGGLPWYCSIPILLLFSLFLGLFTGLPLYVSCYVQRHLGWGFTATLPFAWTAVEYIKSWLLTGFPWDNLAYSQFQALPLIQIADITGVYGVSFLLVLVNGAAAAAVQQYARKKSIAVAEIAAALALLGIVMGYGYQRLAACSTLPERAPLKICLVQPNIPQDLKWDPGYLAATLEKLRTLTRACAAEKPGLVIWPEAATPFFYQDEETYRAILGDIVRETGVYLLFGSPSYEEAPGGQLFFNSAFLLSPRNSIEGKYDKIHLVPYGEYVPLQRFFPFIQKMVEGISDFSPGRDIHTMALPAGPFATLICYEIIFPDLVRRFVDRGARCIVNITNDAWFGATSAPQQHLSMAVFRAVENRRFIARCANTGISAFISPAGLIMRQTNIFTEAVLSDMIYCIDQRTLYTRYGDIFALLCVATGVLLMILARMRKRQ
jgi:apolipoprotein N-acyltransferase